MIKVKSGQTKNKNKKKKKQTKAFMVEECNYSHRFVVWRYKAKKNGNSQIKRKC